MAKVVIIGIDGLDPFLLEKWKQELPNLGKLFNKISDIAIESTIPADSICAWTSIFTGKNPAEHGFVESVDYLASKKAISSINWPIGLKGETFWDAAVSQGKTVCVINPFMAYPAWEVNGVMISGPVFESGEISAYPKNILDKYKFPPLGGIVDVPHSNNLKDFINRTKKSTIQLSDSGIQMYKDYKPELFFITFLTLDRIKHFLWRFTDAKDPYYPGRNPFENVIKDFYLIFDGIIGKFISSLDKDAALLVISDHGHRGRPPNCLNLNEFLRRKGYITINDKNIFGIFRKLLEKIKVFTISAMSKCAMEDYLYKLAKLIPNRKVLKKSTYLIDKSRSSVSLSGLCGTSPLGGINISADSKEEYESIRDNLIKDLKQINITLGSDVVKQVMKREQVYKGKCESVLPDIFFELDTNYGVGMNFFVPLVSKDYGHRKISGGHKKEAVFLVCGDKTINNFARPSSIIGIKDYIAEIIGC